jgi:hypothetical protein
MGGPLQLSPELAEDVRNAAAERGFADPETYLRWLLSRHEHGQIVEESRIDRLEARLDEVESKLSSVDAGTDAHSENNRAQALIDEKLPNPNGADDEDVSSAISEVERRL